MVMPNSNGLNTASVPQEASTCAGLQRPRRLLELLVIQRGKGISPWQVLCFCMAIPGELDDFTGKLPGLGRTEV